VQLRPWQAQLIDDLYELRPDGLRRYRRGLIGMPRKNGKSLLGSIIALYHLIADGEPGAEVYSAAGGRDQARIVFGEARRMVQAEPELAGIAKLYRDAIEIPTTGAVYRVLSAEAGPQEGLSPSAVIFDEVHVQPDERLWDVLTLGSGARVQPLVIGITTAGYSKDSLCYRLYEYGRSVNSGAIDDPSFFFRWWEPSDVNCDYRDPNAWQEANPALDDFLSLEDMEVAARQTHEAAFRRYRLNQWTATATAWLPHGAWDACASHHEIPDGTDVVLGFDGSFSGDTTAIVAVSLEDRPHVQLVGLWEPSQLEDDRQQVPIADVEDAIRTAAKRWRVQSIVADPYRWARSLQSLAAEGLPVLEFPQSPARMTPATARMTEAVLQRLMTHDGDPRLALHVANAALKNDARGQRLAKALGERSRRIDAAVAMVMAYDEAARVRSNVARPAILDLADYLKGGAHA
jgi:phage terminase large subunit-like protein